jgi:hypothetical protein
MFALARWALRCDWVGGALTTCVRREANQVADVHVAREGMAESLLLRQCVGVAAARPADA